MRRILITLLLAAACRPSPDSLACRAAAAPAAAAPARDATSERLQLKLHYAQCQARCSQGCAGVDEMPAGGAWYRCRDGSGSFGADS